MPKTRYSDADAQAFAFAASDLLHRLEINTRLAALLGMMMADLDALTDAEFDAFQALADKARAMAASPHGRAISF